MWMALDRTRYMQSSKTFVMVDRPFWKDRDPVTGRDVMSMTLTDRLTRGTYLFDNGDDKPAVICLTYSWMCDALKMLPQPPVERVSSWRWTRWRRSTPTLDIASHIIGDPITVCWEADPNFLGAFKGALPGHYRYNHRMYGHFMQDGLPPAERGIFLAGDDVSLDARPGSRARCRRRSTRSGASCTTSAASPSRQPGPGRCVCGVGADRPAGIDLGAERRSLPGPCLHAAGSGSSSQR